MTNENPEQVELILDLARQTIARDLRFPVADLGVPTHEALLDWLGRDETFAAHDLHGLYEQYEKLCRQWAGNGRDDNSFEVWNAVSRKLEEKVALAAGERNVSREEKRS